MDADPFDVVLAACRDAFVSLELIGGNVHRRRGPGTKAPGMAVRPPAPARYPVSTFTAFTMCPECGEVGLFDLHEPPEVDAAPPPVKESVVTYGGTVARTIGGTHHRTDKTTCDVVRECPKCHARWGEV